MTPAPDPAAGRPAAVVAIIPARLGSTRFPGKVLADATGRPLIRHVHDAARAAPSVGRVVIAADDPRILDAARAFGAEAVLTRPDHPNGTSRLAEAAAILGLAPDAIVVNVQGDEPELDPGTIAALVSLAQRTAAPVSTIAAPFGPAEDPADPNIVKVVLDRAGHALYFSRARIPHARAGGTTTPPLRHVGLYAYRVPFLATYADLEPTPLEGCEMLEQLRILEHGGRIAVAVHPCSSQGIDTPEQYAAFVTRWRAAHPS